MAHPKPNRSVSHSATIAFPGQANASERTRQLRRVGQDKSGLKAHRPKLSQAASNNTTKRIAPENTSFTSAARSQKQSGKRKAIPKTIWLAPSLAADLSYIAKREGLSFSSTVNSLLAEAVRQRLHVQHAVLLEPIIQESIRKELRGLSTRLALLLVRVAFNTGQTRRLVVNVLGRQQNVTEETLTTILDASADAAKKDILRRSPSLAPVIADIERWLLDENEP